jgi:SAM-dependent methyltransferase
MQSPADLQDKIRQQFDSTPYPINPIDQTPEGQFLALFMYAVATPYYLKHQKVPNSQDLVILDAGCGTGYTSLILAMANPGARIVGLDPSAESIRLAEARFEYHAIANAEFHVGILEDLSQISQTLGTQFDCINCDEVLYLLPDLPQAMAALRSVLKPEGILRGNLNNLHQRAAHYRGQELFRRMGLMEQNPGELEIDLVIETMQALRPHVGLKQRTWQNHSGRGGDERSSVLLNYLLQGDRGYTVPDLFELLEGADLDFLSMVNWRQWELLDLFSEPENLPVFWQMTLPELSLRQRLEMYELLHPIHRLLDFWATPHQAVAPAPSVRFVSDWTLTDWQQATVQWHPALCSEALKEFWADKIQQRQPINFAEILPEEGKQSLKVDANLAACLWPLWEGEQSVQTIVDRYLQIEPIDPLTLQPRSVPQAWTVVITLLSRLEVLLYVLLVG